MDAVDGGVLERCRRIGAGTWSDALDALGIAGVVRGLALRSGGGRFAGTAATARASAGGLGDHPRAAFAVEKIVAAAGAGRVLMVEMGGAVVSTFGGMAALAASMQGAAAVVIDGGCRDVDEILATGLWLASRHATPTSGKRRVTLESLGEPVTVGGIAVRAGDLVAGDETGIVVVPRQRIAAALAEAERLMALDARIESALRAGQSFAAATAAAGYV